MTDLVIFGTSRFAEIVHDYVTACGAFNTRAFTADREHMDVPSLSGLPVVPFEEVVDLYPPERHRMIIAVGYSRFNEVRMQKYLRAKSMGYKMASFVHPTSTVPASAEIGDHCLIFEQNVIQPFARIGNNVIIWSSNVICHHSSVGDHCFVTSNVVVAGAASLGERTFVGFGSNIGPDVRVGARCLIGAGALVLSDAEDDGVYAAAESPRRRVPSGRVRLL